MICFTRPLLCAIVLGLAILSFLAIIFMHPRWNWSLLRFCCLCRSRSQSLARRRCPPTLTITGQMAPVTHYAPLYPLIVSSVGFIGIDPLEGSERLEGLRVDAICWQVERNNSCLYQCARFNLPVSQQAYLYDSTKAGSLHSPSK